MNALFENFSLLFIESAPWLLLGLLVAGVIKFAFPTSLLQRHMAGDNLLTVSKAALIGAPLPLCSCGVIPAALGLRKSGASASATVSFLVSTPETGVDSISVSYALLGPFMAIIRPLSAIATAIATGILVLIYGTNKTSSQNQPSSAQSNSSCSQSCCGSSESSAKADKPNVSLWSKLKDIWLFASGEMLSDISKWLLIGLLFAAMVKTWMPEDFLMQWGDGFIAMLVMALVGIPMYICATASTPVAAGFLAAGVSPGAVLVFLLAGPATNLATMGMIKQELGKNIMLIYVMSIICFSILLGFLCNWLVDTFSFQIWQVAAAEHEMAHSLAYQASAVLLALMMAKNMLTKLPLLSKS